jgi:toxin ParE1/3/4
MKPRPLHWRAAALEDIEALATYYAREGGAPLGLKFVAALEAAMTLIAEYPDSGSRRHAYLFPDLPTPLRFHPLRRFDSVLVCYLALPRAVEIVRVWNAARGLEALLEEASDE